MSSWRLYTCTPHSLFAIVFAPLVEQKSLIFTFSSLANIARWRSFDRIAQQIQKADVKSKD